MIMLQFYPWWRSARDGILEGLYYREPEIDKTVLAQVSCGVCAWPPAGEGLWPRTASCPSPTATTPPWLCTLHCYTPVLPLSLLQQQFLQYCFPFLQYYDVPVVSLRAAAWRLMHAGIEGFKVRRQTQDRTQPCGAGMPSFLSGLPQHHT